MAEPVSTLIVSNIVTAEDAERFDGSNIDRISEVAGACLVKEYWIKTPSGGRHLLPSGYWVVRYGPGDIGVLSDGAWQRWFGGPGHD